MPKIMRIYYDNAGYPYKDSALSVRYPIVEGNEFTGANNTTEVHFYTDNLGQATWVANCKLPNGELLYRLLVPSVDEQGNTYQKLPLDRELTNFQGHLKIGLNGYYGNISVDEEELENNSIVIINGTPSIIATGVVDIAMNYSPVIIPLSDLTPTQYDYILAILGNKLDITKGIYVIDDITNVDYQDYALGQIFYDKTSKLFYRREANGFILENIDIANLEINGETLSDVLDSFVYEEELENYYTKTESDTTFVPQTRTIDGVPLDHDIQANELIGLVQALKHSYFNPNDEDIILNKYLNRETGVMTDATSSYNFVISGFIPIKNGDIVRWTKGANIGAIYSYAYYDENKQFVSSNFNPSTSYEEYFELTVNNSLAKYIRITMRSTVAGDFTGLQCLINEEWVNGIVYNYIGSNKVLDNILDKQITPNYLSCVEKLSIKNLFNKNATGIKDNYYLDQSGNEVASTSFAISDFIEIKPNSQYLVNYDALVNANYAGCYYDENKQFIANAPVTSDHFENIDVRIYGSQINPIPSNAKYIRTNIAKTNVPLSEYMFIENNFSLTYIPYNVADYKANNQVDFLNDNAKQTLLDNSKRELLGNYNFLYKSKMIAFGDSICAGAGWAGGYAKIIGDKYEMTYSNEGRSGSTITPNMKIGPTSPVGCITEIFATINPQMQYDYLLLEGGINDWNCSQGVYSQYNPDFVFGTYNMKDYDTTHLVDTTFCGSFEKLLSSALSKYQNTKIIFIIVHKYATIYNENDAEYNTVKDWYNYWIPAIKDMCNKWGIAVVDLNKNCPPFNFVTAYKNAYTSSSSDGQGNPDGIHPNENGYKYYYVPEIIRKMVKWIEND